MGDYHDLCLKTDVCLLADVFENFRTARAGPSALLYISMPVLGCNAKKRSATGAVDRCGHLFIEQATRGGILMESKRDAKANNLHVGGYNSNKPNNHIQYLDVNDLYSRAMCKSLTKRKFAWKTVMPTEEQIHAKKEQAKRGWILEVNVEYLAELHTAHSGYLFAPEKKKSKENGCLITKQTWQMSWG